MLPLLAPRALHEPLAWRAGQPISAATFLGEAQALAALLPASGRPVNLCQDRYLFALGLAAALMRGQTSLMPPNALPETLAGLRSSDAEIYALVDSDELDLGGLLRVRVARSPDAPALTDVPLLAADLDAVCLLTSGSTGPPQPHHKRWGALVANIGAEAERLADFMGRASMAGVTLLATVPAQHSYGFESSVLLALLGGAAFDAGRPYFPADIADALARLPQPRALVTTPFHLKTLLLADVALPPVELLLSATAPLSPQLAGQAEQHLQGTLVEIYGCTEAGQVAARRTTAGETWTTLGQLRLWHEHDAQGAERFMVLGGHVLEPTPLADVLVLQDERRFRLLGRANDLIHVAGKRSSLAHLNFHLNRIAGVDDGAFWMPVDAADSVTRPVAFVVAPTLGARQIIAALREHLEATFVPRRVVHVAALPREATGKLTAQSLARFAAHHLPADTGAHSGEPAPSAAPASVGTPPRDIEIAADHPAFAGHFPGAPVLPGVALLSLVMQAVDADATLRDQYAAPLSISQVKFLAPVGPGARLQVALQPLGRGLAFDVHLASHAPGASPLVVARGQLTPGAGRP
jgi:acyl-coenzyme A synthetase/AMP-(fatty) acid ligase